MNEMTSKERFLTALSRKQPDRVPCFDFLFSLELFEHILGGKLDEDYVYNAEDALKCADALGFDGLWVPFGGLVGDYSKMLPGGKYIDEWGTTFIKNSASWPIDGPVDYPIRTRNDFKNYVPPSPDHPSRMTEVKTALKLNNGKIAIMGGLNGPLTTATFLMGLEDICINLYEDPELLEDIFKLSNKFWIEAGKKLVNEGVDLIGFGEDLGYDKSLFASPQLLKKHLFPYIKELVTTFTDMGVPVVMHSDGRLHDIFADVVDLGITGYHPSERKSGMTLKWVKENFGNRICLFGNVDSSITLPYGTPEAVEQEVLQCIQDAAAGGGYILGSDHSLHDGIPVENIFRMFEAAKKYGKYA